MWTNEFPLGTYKHLYFCWIGRKRVPWSPQALGAFADLRKQDHPEEFILRELAPPLVLFCPVSISRLPCGSPKQPGSSFEWFRDQGVTMGE